MNERIQAMKDPRTKREQDEDAGVDVDDPGYVSGDEDDSYADESGGQSETIDGMD
jgi:hypothetical protein